MRRKSTPEPISDVMRDVLEKLTRTKKQETHKVSLTWRSIVSKELAKHTRPLGVRKGTLLVLVEDSAWFYQINLKKPEILNELNKKKGFEKVKTIQFRLGKTHR